MCISTVHVRLHTTQWLGVPLVAPSSATVPLCAERSSHVASLWKLYTAHAGSALHASQQADALSALDALPTSGPLKTEPSTAFHDVDGLGPSKHNRASNTRIKGGATASLICTVTLLCTVIFWLSRIIRLCPIDLDS